jgi:hypothetical protein
MLRILPLPCDIPSSDKSRFLFLKIGRIAKENYKPIIIHFSCDVRSSHQSHFLFFPIGRIAEENYKPIIIHFSCDVRSSHQSHFLFFEISRIDEQNYAQKSSFVLRCSILWWMWLFSLRNDQNTWSQLWWEIFLCHVIFHHLMNLAIASSKLAE